MAIGQSRDLILAAEFHRLPVKFFEERCNLKKKRKWKKDRVTELYLNVGPSVRCKLNMDDM